MNIINVALMQQSGIKESKAKAMSLLSVENPQGLNLVAYQELGYDIHPLFCTSQNCMAIIGSGVLIGMVRI